MTDKLTAEERERMVREIGEKALFEYDRLESRYDAYSMIDSDDIKVIRAAILAERKPVRWVPEEGEAFWYINSAGIALQLGYYGTLNGSQSIVDSGNCYRTEAEATHAARLRRVRETADRLRDEIAGECEGLRGIWYEWGISRGMSSYVIELIEFHSMVHFSLQPLKFKTKADAETFRARLEQDCGPGSLHLLLTGSEATQ